MTTLAGNKIRRYREAHSPKIGRPAFAAEIGASAGTLQGWEEEGKRPESADIVNELARRGIADHADWFRPARCPRCELHAEDESVEACAKAHCPMQMQRRAAA
ncbi:hypothetical protein [Sphingomonas alpina]|uniref:Helix-turn-helix transcriptional regulator n=1 Tax=Sphingomonas alpina TaxID=653931 RepID=A0A7H0LHX6_9SPHN|nr:hypothetical protein [Sphingomonas alpina]QNQ09279.1 hypothetical protein H3Z74_21835 [Sphingomonas alpina]